MPPLFDFPKKILYNIYEIKEGENYIFILKSLTSGTKMINIIFVFCKYLWWCYYEFYKKTTG